MLVLPSSSCVVSTLPNNQKVKVVLISITPFILLISSQKKFVDSLIKIFFSYLWRNLHPYHFVNSWHFKHLYLFPISRFSLLWISKRIIAKPTTMNRRTRIDINKAKYLFLLLNLSNFLLNHIFKSKLFQTNLANKVVFPPEKMVLRHEHIFRNLTATRVNESKTNSAN